MRQVTFAPNATLAFGAKPGIARRALPWNAMSGSSRPSWRRAGRTLRECPDGKRHRGPPGCIDGRMSVSPLVIASHPDVA